MKWLYLMLLVLSVSCKNKLLETTIDTRELKQYYEADTIELIEESSVLKVLVTNSRFVESKMSVPEHGKVYKRLD